MREFGFPAELLGAVGEEIGPGPWFPVDQGRVDAFAAVTEDRQWIHTDPARAAAGPFGGTVAHGYLTLALLPVLAGSVYRVGNVRMAVNYGLNRVRFPAPVLAGRSVRATVSIDDVQPLAGPAGPGVRGAVQLVTRVTVEVEGSAKPCCVAETVARLYPEEDPR